MHRTVLLSMMMFAFLGNYAQDRVDVASNEMTKNLWGLFGGTTSAYVGVCYERILTPDFGLDLRVGAWGVSGGLNYYINGLQNGKVGFRTGAHFGIGEGYTFTEDDIFKGKNIYIPIGIHYMSRNNVFLGLDAGPTYWIEEQRMSYGITARFGLPKLIDLLLPI